MHKQAALQERLMSYSMPLSSGLYFTSYSTLLYSFAFPLHVILHSLYQLMYSSLWCSHNASIPSLEHIYFSLRQSTPCRNQQIKQNLGCQQQFLRFGMINMPCRHGPNVCRLLLSQVVVLLACSLSHLDRRKKVAASQKSLKSEIHEGLTCKSDNLSCLGKYPTTNAGPPPLSSKLFRSSPTMAEIPDKVKLWITNKWRVYQSVAVTK